jgi:hypothetical protein
MHELSGQIPQVDYIPELEYQPITIDQSLDLPIIPNESALHVSEPGPSNASHSPKRKADAASDNQSSHKVSKRTCQKCGNQDCSGRASRRWCKGACQDCGKVECQGRNSQHPKKTCAVGWDFHHKKLK